MNSFIKGFVAAVTGDNTMATAEKAWRQAESFLTVEISNLKGKTVLAEIAVEEAEARILKARINNGEIIKDRETYVKNLIGSQNRLVEAKESLEAIHSKIHFFNDQLKEMKKEE